MPANWDNVPCNGKADAEVRVLKRRAQVAGSEGASQLRYVAIRRALESAIADGRLPPGTIIAEGELADIFGVSRNPVRRALEQLVTARLLSPRTPEHGPVVVGPGADRMVAVQMTLELLGLQENAALDVRSSAQRVLEDLECMVATALLFDSFEINEQEAADHYAVSRMTLREVLSRLQDRGLVEKVPYGSWIVHALSAERVKNEYGLRLLLEPAALGIAASRGVTGLSSMIARAERLQSEPDTYLASIDDVENDLHQTCVGSCGNGSLLKAVQQNLVSRSIGLTFSRALPLVPDLAPIDEHVAVLKALFDANPEEASRLASLHLTRSCARNARKLRTLSSIGVSDLPHFLTLIRRTSNVCRLRTSSC
jgi:DNA-binding GntR family transcriptional regulator